MTMEQIINELIHPSKVYSRAEVARAQYGPKQVAVGAAGFNGYIMLEFENKDFVVCESLFYGNATYIFGDNWEEISQLSKAEILRDDLHRERSIHRKWSWLGRIRELLS